MIMKICETGAELIMKSDRGMPYHAPMAQQQKFRRGGTAIIERDNDIWRMYIDGASLYQLARHFDMAPQNVKKRLDKLRDQYGQLERVDAETMRQRLIGSALDVMRHLAELMHADPIPAYSNGKPIIDDRTGEQAMDYSTRINAAKALLQANKRLAELTGADSAQQIEITVTAQAQQSAEEAAEAALRRVFGTHATEDTVAPALPAAPADPDEIIIDAFVQEANALLNSVVNPDNVPAFEADQ